MSWRSPVRSGRLSALRGAVLLFLLSASPTLAQTLGQGGDDGISLWRVFAALLICLALAAAGALALRARIDGRLPLPRALLAGGLGQGRRLHLVETLRIGQHVDLCIVTCDGRELLIAASGQGAQVLERLPVGSASGRQDPE